MGFSQYSISNWKNIKVFLVWNCRQQRRLVPVTYVVHKEHPLRRGHQALCSFISFRAVLRVAGRASMALTTTLIQQWHAQGARGASIRQLCWGTWAKAAVPSFPLLLQTISELRPGGCFIS